MTNRPRLGAIGPGGGLRRVAATERRAKKLRIPSPSSGRSLDRYTESLIELILGGVAASD